MDIQTEEYTVQFDAETSTIVLQGYLRLDGMAAYQPIVDLILSAVESSNRCTIDLHDLEFLNSSGISMLSMLIVKLRDAGRTNLAFKGSSQVLWQTRSLKNLKRLMPSLEIEMVD